MPGIINSAIGGDDIQVVQPTQQEMAAWPKRADGSQKGLGYFGLMKRPDGQVSSELSIGVNFGGKETEIPLIVPTLSRDEVSSLLSGAAPTKEIVDKAVQHALERMKAGKNPFAGDGEQVPLPAPAAAN